MSNSQWLKKRKIASLPGVMVDPVMVLARTLEKAQAGEIEACSIVVRWKDGTHDTDWSQMKHSEFSHMAIVLMDEAMHMTREGT
jgi:hypothetical protein